MFVDARKLHMRLELALQLLMELEKRDGLMVLTDSPLKSIVAAANKTDR